MRIAIGTDDTTSLHDDHMGESARFLIYDVSQDETRLVETRQNRPYDEDPAHPHGDPGKARLMSKVFAGVDVLVARHFGPNVKRMLRRFVCVRVRADTVDEALALISSNLPSLEESQRQGAERRPIVLP